MSRPRARAASILREIFPDRAPVLLAANLQVKNVDRQLRFLRNANGEIELAILLGAFAADVRHVDAVVFRDHLRDLEHFFGLLGPSALEPRHQSPGALLHRAGGERFHAFELRDRRGPGVVADRDQPKLLEGDLRNHIHGDSLLPERAPIPGEIGPRVFRFRQPIAWRHRRALADDVDRHSLADLALGIAVGQQALIRMRVQIDEARRHDQSFRVDLPRRRGAGQRPTATMRSPRTPTSPANHGLPVPSTI